MTAIHRLPGRPHQGHTRRGDSFCHAYLELEPAIRDLHRQAKLAMLAADDPSEYPDEDGDNSRRSRLTGLPTWSRRSNGNTTN